MNIPPPAALVGLAGTHRAVARAGDAQSTAAQAAGNQQRADHPAGRGDTADLVEAGDAASDGEADGRRSLEHQQQQHREENQPPPTRPRPNPAGAGGQVDFDA